MPNPPKVLARRIEKVIDTLAHGNSWETAASRVRCKVTTIREWPHKYADFWARRMASVQHEVDQEVLGAARHILRRQVFNDNIAIARDAARLLLEFARRRLEPVAKPPAAQSRLLPIFEELEGMSHEQLCQYVDEQSARSNRDGTDAGRAASQPG